MQTEIANSKKGMSHIMRKPDLCICENKGADQLRSDCTADQRLCFYYIDSTFPLLPKSRNFKPLASLCGCTWFVSDLVGNPEEWFSHDEAQICLGLTFETREDFLLCYI